MGGQAHQAPLTKYEAFIPQLGEIHMNTAQGEVSVSRLGRRAAVAACCAFLMLVAGCQTVVYEADIVRQPTMNFPEARRTIANEVRKASFGGGYFEDVQVTINGFSVNSPVDVAFIRAGKYAFQFDKINHVAVVHEGETYAIDIGPPWYVHWKSEEDVLRFLDGVRAMKYYASSRPLVDDAAPFASFRLKAREWRALPVKPLLPEQAQQFRVLAEDALRNKEFQKAADYYEQGLAITPLWPQGQFNAAILAGELGTYSRAVLHMKRYLELSPDAADAQSAREQMIIWQSKLPND
jgi:hypothetical protein